MAHDYLWQANKTSLEKNDERMALYDKAALHFANIVVREDANDTVRADALFTLRWIAAYIRHDYEMALQYLNQYLEIVGPEHESYPTCLAYKADDLWHFGAHDSAMHYAYKALEAPHTPHDRIEYICHHILWNIYDSREIPDSAHKHKVLHTQIRDSRAFEPMSMEELKNQIEADIIASSKEKYNSVYIWLTGAAGLALICILCAFVWYRRRRNTTIAHEEAQTDDKALTSGTSAVDAESLRLALAKGMNCLGKPPYATTSMP